MSQTPLSTEEWHEVIQALRGSGRDLEARHDDASSESYMDGGLYECFRRLYVLANRIALQYSPEDVDELWNTPEDYKAAT